jgi:hypothetical protein
MKYSISIKIGKAKITNIIESDAVVKALEEFIDKFKFIDIHEIHITKI